jgi:colanic acid/amylovoran biosynthesis glycosyltransferase
MIFSHEMKTLTIAHFINPFLPLTQNWIHNQLKFNTKFRNIVLCRTLDNKSDFPLDHVFPAFPEKTLLADLSMAVSRLRAQYCRGFYRKIIKAENPQVLHGHFSWESWRNIGLVKETGLPLITTFYGLDVNKLWRRRVWKKRYEQLFRIGRMFTVEGPYMAERLSAIGCPEEKIRIIPIGVDINRIRSYRISPKNEKIKILFVGLAREKKGAVYAAQAFAKVALENKDCELHIIGEGLYAVKVKNILSSMQVLDRCFFHGYVSFDEYCRTLGETDILMAPSVTAANGDTEGGAPVTITEAQSAGIPVAGTFHCDIPSIVIDRETGLLCPERDVNSLAKNLLRLVTDKSLRMQMGKAAEINAAEKFSIERQVSSLNKIYLSTI